MRPRNPEQETQTRCATARAVLEQIALTMDGKRAAAKTVARKRSVLFNALEYAVESKILRTNRLPEIKWSAPKEVQAIDTRVVINPRQAAALLAAVGAQEVKGQPRRRTVRKWSPSTRPRTTRRAGRRKR